MWEHDARIRVARLENVRPNCKDYAIVIQIYAGDQS